MSSINCSICGSTNRYTANNIPERCIECFGFLRNIDEYITEVKQTQVDEKKKIDVPKQWICPRCTSNNADTIICTICSTDRPANTMRWTCICGHNESHLLDKCTGCFKYAKNKSKCPLCNIESDNIIYD